MVKFSFIFSTIRSTHSPGQLSVEVCSWTVRLVQVKAQAYIFPAKTDILHIKGCDWI